MTATSKILLVGSLPPTQTHAALLTHSIASAAASSGIEIVCLIDALAPPPANHLPYTVVRSFDAFIQSGAADKWPRLFVIGSSGDSLPVIETLQAAPGAVTVATQSLFDNALPWLRTSADFPANMVDWLTSAYGDAGAVIADAYTSHRRSSAGLAGEIPAFDLLLKKATAHLGLNPLQASRLTGAGFAPSALPSVPTATTENTISSDNSPLRISIIGADAATASAVSQALNSSGVSQRLELAFLDRFSNQTAPAILASNVVAILDGNDAASCPYFELAATNAIPLILVGQHWAGALPVGACINLSDPSSSTPLVHALAALVSVDGLLGGLAQGLKKYGQQLGQPDAWATKIVVAAATAKQANFVEIFPMFQTQKPEVFTKQPTSSGVNASGIFALIGSVPAQPILRQLYPELDVAACPKFLTPEIAQATADFIGLPAAQLQDRMGFEAPLVASNQIVSDQAESLPQTSSRKPRLWADILPGLRRASQALEFGCTVKGAASTPPSVQKANWTFKIPADIAENEKIRSAYDSNSGFYWTYDPVRGELKCIVMTGGRGCLEFRAPADTSFVVTDMSATNIAKKEAGARFEIPDHGLGMFKIAILPSSNTSSLNMMKSLAQDGLLLEWSAL